MGHPPNLLQQRQSDAKLYRSDPARWRHVLPRVQQQVFALGAKGRPNQRNAALHQLNGSRLHEEITGRNSVDCL